VSRLGLGLLGGTFDPVHRAHLQLGQAARRQLALETVFLIPAARPPLKLDCTTPAETRLRMVELATRNESGLEACGIELERKGTSYTVDTLRSLHALHHRRELWFLIGTDALRDLNTWREPDQILSLASLGVVERGLGRPPKALEEFMPPHFANQYRPTADGWAHSSGRELRIIPFEGSAISSSQIREYLRAGKSVAEWLPASVIEFIHSHQLYQEDS